MKEADKTPEKELIESSNQPGTEFKTLAIRMLKELRERIDVLNENFDKEIGNIKMV